MYDDLENMLDTSGKVEVWIEQMSLYHDLGDAKKSDQYMQQVRLNMNPQDVAMQLLFANKLFQMQYYTYAQEYIDAILNDNAKNRNAL